MRPHEADIPRLLREDYKPEVDPYEVEIPAIKSASDYYFTTDSGLRYQVLFARKKEKYLEHIVNFGVLNEEFEDEYSETNRGEIYKIIATVVEIIRIYQEIHYYSTAYEFSGEFKDNNEQEQSSIRSRLYLRKAKRILHPSWTAAMIGNKVILSRKTNRA